MKIPKEVCKKAALKRKYKKYLKRNKNCNKNCRRQKEIETLGAFNSLLFEIFPFYILLEHSLFWFPRFYNPFFQKKDAGFNKFREIYFVLKKNFKISWKNMKTFARIWPILEKTARRVLYLVKPRGWPGPPKQLFLAFLALQIFRWREGGVKTRIPRTPLFWPHFSVLAILGFFDLFLMFFWYFLFYFI